jgi:hypothetical protein
MPHEEGHIINGFPNISDPLPSGYTNGPPSVPDWRWPSGVPANPLGLPSKAEALPPSPPGVPTGGGEGASREAVVLPVFGTAPNAIRPDQLGLLQRLGFDTTGVLTQEDFQGLMNQSFGPGGAVRGQGQPVSQAKIAKLIGGEVAPEQSFAPVQQFMKMLTSIFGDTEAANLLAELFSGFPNIFPAFNEDDTNLTATTVAR